MEFTLTEHAKKRCHQRKIKLEWIQNALDTPLQIENDAKDDTHGTCFVADSRQRFSSFTSHL